MTDYLLESVSVATMSAVLRDLPERVYMAPKWDPEGGERHHRPPLHDLQVWVFPETWASTALGYGGIGGNSITSAYTVVVGDMSTDTACVYWGSGGRLGRKVSYSEGRAMIVKGSAP